jgi:hypothetical protein
LQRQCERHQPDETGGFQQRCEKTLGGAHGIGILRSAVPFAKQQNVTKSPKLNVLACFLRQQRDIVASVMSLFRRPGQDQQESIGHEHRNLLLWNHPIFVAHGRVN